MDQATVLDSNGKFIAEVLDSSNEYDGLSLVSYYTWDFCASARIFLACLSAEEQFQIDRLMLCCQIFSLSLKFGSLHQKRRPS